MTQQTINSLKLYKGGKPSIIEQFLLLQRRSVVNELMSHFNAKTISKLSERLSMGF